MKEDGLRYIYYLQVCTWGIPHESCITCMYRYFGETQVKVAEFNEDVIECKIPDKVTF